MLPAAICACSSDQLVTRSDESPATQVARYTAQRPPCVPIDPGAIIRLLHTNSKRYRLDGPNRLRIVGEFAEAEDRAKAIGELLGALDPTQEASAKTDVRRA